MDPSVVDALRSAEGRALLTDATAHDNDAHGRAAAGDARAIDPLKAASSLRRAHPGANPSLVSAALSQVRMRRRARPRLGDIVDSLLMTDDGSEQATRTVAAELRAVRYLGSGATHVADLGCGIGLDSIAFARMGLTVTAVESDPLTAALAAANVEELGLADRVRVIVGDVTDDTVLATVLASADAVFVDPARRDPASRNEGRSARVTDPELWSPRWSWVVGVAARVPRTAAKVAPGVPHELTPVGGCATWTSVDGDLVEAEFAWPAMDSAGNNSVRRRALIVRKGEPTSLTSTIDLLDQAPPPVGDIGSWLLEPDDAVIRSGLVSDLAALLGGRLLDPRVAYITTDTDPGPSPLAAHFRVELALPLHIGRLRDALRERGVGRVVIKKRAIGQDPDDIRRVLALPPGPHTAVVLITRIGDDPWAFVCDIR
ncbi:unannotated protein [freshwater metagenome]|uniref:Unannotated protein n=1 Tax=freshwater metagenome TaxID=449393 RepID=A0A6J7JM20_9ZZZZ|nr:methyltransferase domain-containing protein [Actinomycetota bacterium]